MSRRGLMSARRPTSPTIPATSRLDDFNRANSSTTLGTPSDGGSAWLVDQGTWGISSNQAYSVTYADGDRIAFALDTHNAIVAARLYNTGTGKWPGVYAEDPGTTARYYVEVVEATGKVELWRRSSTGAFALLYASATGVFTSGAKLTMEQRVTGTGTTLTVKVDATTLTTVNDTAAARILNATKFGIRLGRSASPASPDLRFDDFTLTRTDSPWSTPVSVTTFPDTVAVVPELPFAMPSLASMKASSRKVGAYIHTLPTYWRQGNNLYADSILPSSAPANGGRWRQRPLPLINHTTITQSQREQYALDDLTNAANIGIDFFSVNIIGTVISSEAWRMTEHIMPIYTAAAQYNTTHPEDFGVCPDLSMLSIANTGGTATAWADAMAPLLGHAAAYKWTDGRPVCFLYNVDDRPASWYQDFANRLDSAHSIDVACIPHHQANNITALDTTEYKALFSSGVFVALHMWNAPKYTTTPANYFTAPREWAATNGIPFVGGSGPGWEIDRPNLLKELEGKGLEQIRNAFQASIQKNDPMLEIISWGDHEESHNIRPSTAYQWVPYDITAYYIGWYKSGSPPQITRDALYYAHRMHLSTAPYDTSRQTAGAFSVMQGPVLDLVLTYAFLTAPADVVVTTGGVARTHANVPAGITLLEDPFAADSTFNFRAVRSGTTTAQVNSAFPTRSSIVWQDLLYRMGSSTRPPVDGVQSTLPQDRD
jgi:hypothetical protein